MSIINLETPWVEKYRPERFEDIVSQNIAIRNLKKFVKNGNMPHMIFTGPAGTGKTSTALIVAKTMLKSDANSLNILELNASDTVRMDYVRTVIKDFVNQSIISSNINLKFIILDEADNIPSQVQQALRRIIEKTSNKVKFILMCNYINKIIDPIISRCAVFRFSHLTKESIIKRLKYIVSEEKISISNNNAEQLYEILFFISGGDLRKAINTLQMSVSLDLIENLNLDEIYRISGYVSDDILKELFEAIKGHKIKNVNEILKSINNIDSRNFIRQISYKIPELNMNTVDLLNVFELCGDIDYRISQGSDENIQLTALIANLIESIN